MSVLRGTTRVRSVRNGTAAVPQRTHLPMHPFFFLRLRSGPRRSGVQRATDPDLGRPRPAPHSIHASRFKSFSTADGAVPVPQLLARHGSAFRSIRNLQLWRHTIFLRTRADSLDAKHAGCGTTNTIYDGVGTSQSPLIINVGRDS